MLFGGDAAFLGLVALVDLGQAVVVVIIRCGIVAAFLVDLEEPIEEHDLAGGAQADLLIGTFDLDRGAFEAGGGHLAGERALPDQVIELALVGVGNLDLAGVARHVGGPDALVRFLRVLGLVLVHARAVGDVFGAVAILDGIAGGVHGLGGHVDAVGPHVGDEAGLVEPLRRAHGLAGAHAELAAGLLLQGGGHEGGRGVARGGLGLDARDRQVAAGDGLHRQFGLGLVGDVVAVELLAGPADEAGLEFLAAGGGEEGFHGPVFAGLERLDLHLALDDEAETDRLHPAGRAGAGEFAPEHGAEVEAHEIVERAAGEIGLDQRGIDLARVLHCLGDGGFGDGVEDHAADRRVFLEGLALAQRLFEVPADRLAFAVGVGCENERVVILQRVGDGLDVLAAVSADLPGHVEAVFGVDRAVLGGQVAHMAVGGQNRVVGSQVLVDGLGLGRGFNDDNWHENSFRLGGRLWRGNMWAGKRECQ